MRKFYIALTASPNLGLRFDNGEMSIVSKADATPMDIGELSPMFARIPHNERGLYRYLPTE